MVAEGAMVIVTMRSENSTDEIVRSVHDADQMNGDIDDGGWWCERDNIDDVSE